MKKEKFYDAWVYFQANSPVAKADELFELWFMSQIVDPNALKNWKAEI